ncbi:hypothetical protein LshimejAT787_0304400 [Lyophyllum shimeji]|uniref:Uncharacterized protein n=1 Tax=Lyophyllum shimeji TaxID=47721 RepID=A0A9P3PIV5_LYOSH|nr:hypothetical protein LshimejAT787_0304400 [Lyophyllum shimeji]
MVSLLPQPTSLGAMEKVHPKIQLNELGTLTESLEPFTQLILRSGKSAVRLYCSVPTWNCSSDICLDLHDLNELRSRSLLFIHELLHSLRTSGMTASYCLAPSSSPVCLVCAMPPEVGSSSITTAACDILKHAQLSKRENVLVGDLEAGPCLVIT